MGGSTLTRSVPPHLAPFYVLPPHVLYNFQGLDLIDLKLFCGKRRSAKIPSFSPGPGSEFYGVDTKKGPVAGLCLSSIFTVLAGAQK